MNQATEAARTPARGPSNLARNDVMERIQRLALPPEAAPRVLRLVEQELAAERDAMRLHVFNLDEVRRAGAGDDVIEALEKLRADRERARALATSGLSSLSREELEAVIADARNGRS